MFKNLFSKKIKEDANAQITSITILDDELIEESADFKGLKTLKEENTGNSYDPVFLKKTEEEVPLVLVETEPLTQTSEIAVINNEEKVSVNLTTKIDNATVSLKENLADVREKTIQHIGTISDNITEKTKEQLKKYGDDSVQNVNKTLVFTVILCILFAIATLGAVIMYADGQQSIKASESIMKISAEEKQKIVAQNIRLNRMIDQLKLRLNSCMKNHYMGDALISDASLLDLPPIKVNFRSSWLGNGKVLNLKNSSEKHLTVALKVRNQENSKNGDFSISLAPKTKKDWGHLEGWSFTKGDEISLDVSGYRITTKIVP